MPAHAQPSRTPPSAVAPTTTAPVVPTGSRKNPGTAVAISAGFTAGAAALIFLAFDQESESLFQIGGLTALVAPSTGHWYAGRVVNPAMGVRVLAVGLGVAGGFALDSCKYFNAADDSEDPDCSVAIVTTVSAAFLYSLATLYEIRDAASSARAYNRRHGWDVVVAPTAMPSASGASPGVALTGRF